MFAGAYVPVVNTQRDAQLTIYASSASFSTTADPNTVITIPIISRGTPLSMGITYTNRNTSVTPGIPTTTSACGLGTGFQFTIIDARDSLIINATTPFEAVLYLQTTEPEATAQPPMDSVAADKEMAFASTLIGVSAFGVAVVSVAYIYSKVR